MKLRLIAYLKIIVPLFLFLLLNGSVLLAQESSNYNMFAEKDLSRFKVDIPVLNYQGKIGDALIIPIKIQPYPAPSGKFYSILADVIEKPDDARLKTNSGHQQLKFISNQAGVYRLRVKVNLLGKSSCGGVEADQLKVEEIRIEILK